MAPPGRRLVARLYPWSIAVASIAALGYAAWAPGPRAPAPLGLTAELALLAVAAQHFPLAVGPQHKIDTSNVVYLAGVLLLDAWAAVALVGVSQLVGQLTLSARRDPRTRRRLRGARGVLFNTGQVVLAAALAALVYAALVPRRGGATLDRPENLWAIPATIVVLQLANSLAVAVMVALQRGRDPWETWRESWSMGVLERAGLFLMGVVVVLATSHYPWAPLVAALPMAILVLSQRRTLAVLAREQQARDQAEQAQHHLAVLAQEQHRIARQLEHLRGQLDASERERLLHDERGRIARELHDRVEQAFFSIGLTVSAALGGPRGSAPDVLRAALAEASGAARQGAEDLRTAIFALTRAEVHDRGLVQALWQLVREFQQTTGVEADLVVSGAERRAPPELAEALYAVAREGLANVEQHARASAVVVSLRFELDAVTLTVQDDGVGAPVLVLTTLPESATRFGLRGMRERVVRQGGTFTAEPGEEGGFVVRAHVPLPDAGPP